MGQICAGKCELDDLKVNTAFGTCGCAHSTCSCFGNKEEKAVLKKIKTATRVEMNLIQKQIEDLITEAIKSGKPIPKLNLNEVVSLENQLPLASKL
jgi:hypothetical protein